MSVKLLSKASNAKAYAVLTKLRFQVRAGIRQAFYFIGRDLKDTINRDVLDRKSKTGRVYLIRRGRRERRHRASSAGQTPANITGRYRKSMDYKISGSNYIEFGSLKRDRVLYARDLEFGTSRVAPRPGIQNAFKKNERNAQLHYKREVLKSINKGSAFTDRIRGPRF